MSDPNEPRGDALGANELDADVAIEEPGAAAPEPAAPARGARDDVPPPSKWQTMLNQIATGNAIISVLAVLLALVVGAILIAVHR